MDLTNGMSQDEESNRNIPFAFHPTCFMEQFLQSPEHVHTFLHSYSMLLFCTSETCFVLQEPHSSHMSAFPANRSGGQERNHCGLGKDGSEYGTFWNKHSADGICANNKCVTQILRSIFLACSANFFSVLSQVHLTVYNGMKANR